MVHAFKDFLKIMSTSPSVPPELKQYYCTCTRVSLERQVGNHYFVTAANAAGVIFLREAAIEFLRYTGKILAINWKQICEVSCLMKRRWLK